ncbi:MAG: 50S ribosomal protein L35 [Firmicutes bacterium]|jgi:large subunit ribosomal protein L35|nr:50S ribosomal protein L35 [Bacillota bacterium]
MPKQKTHSGLKKRIKVTGTGKLVRGQAYTGHLAMNKTTKQNRQLRGEAQVSDSDKKRIKSLISNML